MHRLEPNSIGNTLEGILIYRLQKKHAIFVKSFHDEAKHIQLLIAWRIEYTKEVYVRALLVEHDSELDEDKLKRLYQKCWHILEANVDLIESKWMIDDTTILTTAVKTINEGYRWNIFISKGKYSSVRPLWIDTSK
jgi:hypothetical protein